MCWICSHTSCLYCITQSLSGDEEVGLFFRSAVHKPSPRHSPAFILSYSVILVYAIQEKTLENDAICVLVWGLSVIMWFGGKFLPIPKCCSWTGGNLSLTSYWKDSSKIAERMCDFLWPMFELAKSAGLNVFSAFSSGLADCHKRVIHYKRVKKPTEEFQFYAVLMQ